jgi:hypothetical protein
VCQANALYSFFEVMQGEFIIWDLVRCQIKALVSAAEESEEIGVSRRIRGESQEVSAERTPHVELESAIGTRVRPVADLRMSCRRPVRQAQLDLQASV